MPSLTPAARILVVEDEAFIRMDVVEVLIGAGFEVVEASNADEAVLILERLTDIRLVFTDIDMPGSMNGLRLAAAIRDRWPPVKIIATSGHHKFSEGDFPAETQFIAKPYKPEQIFAAIRRALQTT
jgi:CheY-like chemotaxis protein